MRLRLFIIALISLACAMPAKAVALPAPQVVEFPSGNATLHAQLYKPQGAGPFPVVIALHGCGGLSGHSEPIQARYRD